MNFIFFVNVNNILQSPIPVTKIFVDKLKNAVSYKRVLYRSNAVVTVPIVFLSHYIKRYKINSMQPYSVLPESIYGKYYEIPQKACERYIFHVMAYAFLCPKIEEYHFRFLFCLKIDHMFFETTFLTPFFECAIFPI